MLVPLFTSAPFSMRSFASSVCPSLTAQKRGVPPTPSFSFTSAPLSSRVRTAFMSPLLAAFLNKGVAQPASTPNAAMIKIDRMISLVTSGTSLFIPHLLKKCFSFIHRNSLIHFIMSSDFYQKYVVFFLFFAFYKIKNNSQVISRTACPRTRKLPFKLMGFKLGSERVLSQKF